jgi:beta-galactosidase
LKHHFGFLILLFALNVTAQNSLNGDGRQVLNISGGWTFSKTASAKYPASRSLRWEQIDLPHTWNVKDVMDDDPGYYRGVGWYRKTLQLPGTFKGKEISFYFEGANQAVSVYINGHLAGTHAGGYTGFSIPATAFLNFDGKKNSNLLEVVVDNSFNQNIPPLTADFTFYGGIYRDVFLVATSRIHFSNAHGANTVFIRTPLVSSDSAIVEVSSSLTNAGSSGAQVITQTIIYDKDGNTISQQQSFNVSIGGNTKTVTQTLPVISHPHLWTPEDPYCYTVVTSLIDRQTRKLLDEVRNPLGFRWFSFDANRGFILNGNPYRLVGASRHQDMQGLGNALPDSLARKDVLLLKKMGANFLRVAHYPQDPAVLNACDELGILASVEIPVVNEITETDSFYQQCMNMQQEMIRQNFNHPSVIVWCYMNEVLLRAHFNVDKPRQKIYFENIRRLAASLDSLTRKEDPSRYTMLVNHGDFDKYRNAGLLEIPMIVGWNLYSGWYGPDLEDFPAFLDEFHKKYPTTPMMVTEYGADADPRIHSLNPVRFDKSVEYSVIFHQFYMKEMKKRPFVAAAVVWNLADFNSETRNETMPHINNKGLLKWDRTAKDPYYLYQALLLKKPFLKILGSDWNNRTVASDSASEHVTALVQVASNFQDVELFANGKSMGVEKVSNGLAQWYVVCQDGQNSFEAKANDGSHDIATINYKIIPWRWDPASTSFSTFNILLGANRYFTEPGTGIEWIPDKPYQKGSWGYSTGQAYKLKGNGRLPYGTDKNIPGTDADPVYQTQRVGLDSYDLDLPPGKYLLTFLFAELVGGKVEALAYDLSNTDRKEEEQQRVFNVYVNDHLAFEKVSLDKNGRPLIKSIMANATATHGIHISFKAITGEPVLNALRVRRL